MPEKPSYVALRVSLIYAVVAGLWILLSDMVASWLFTDPATRMAVETYKGLAFVTVTAVLLYLTVRGYWRRMETKRITAETEIRQLNIDLERRVAERTAALAAKNRELETFTYSVSHDLKAPLRGIDGYSRLLLEDYSDKLDDEGRHFLHMVRQSARQMGQLIDDLLSYSRLERREWKSGEVDLQRLVESFASEREEELHKRGGALKLKIPSVKVSADADGLGMALRNLIDNAIKFTGTAPQPIVEITGRETEKACILSVKDNGVGFDMKFHDRIFDIFQRLHRSEDYPGTGIGLTIVRKAMQRMGGRVWAESEPGGGATFYLEIPK